MVIPKINSVYSFQGFILDVTKRKLQDPTGQPVKLGSRAFDTLVELIQHQGELVTKDYLMNTIWSDMIVEENNINQAIRIIRKALKDSSSESKFIQTIPGKGYCFVADIVKEELNQESPVETNTPEQPETSRFLEITAHPYFKASTVFLSILLLVGLFFLLRSPFENGANEQTNLAHSQSINAFPGAAQNLIIQDSIAVLPFTNINQGNGSELFVLGLHDELINQLSKITSLKIIARDSVVSLHEQGMSSFEISELLNVESLIEGTILVVGENARINLQMLNANTGIVLWSNSVEVNTHDLSKMISMQSQIAFDIVNALELEIQSSELEDISMLSTQSFEAYRYFLAAKTAHEHQDNEEKWGLIKKALEVDPNYLDAHLVFASINSALSINPLVGLTHTDHLQYMLASSEAAIQIEPGRPEGYALKAVAMGMKKNWEGSAQQIELLDGLGASLAQRKYLGMLLMCLGDFQGAINIYEDSLITEPVNLYLRGLLMAAHEMAGNQDRAREAYIIGNELKSAWWGDNVNILLALGRNEPLVGVDDVSNVSPALTYALHNLNDSEVVAQSVQNYIDDEAKIPSEAIFYGALAAHYNDIKSASTLLRVSMDKTPTSIFWTWLPVFKQVRRTESFKNILMDFGLISYWTNHGWPEICQPQDASFECH